jgi:valyl-tRNA synthetase
MDILDKKYKPSDHEEKIYSLWEKSAAFTPRIDKKKKPYTIILPPPNANDHLHAGHALYAVEDTLIRYHRMLGEAALWLPGTDHAGIETQFVFEKKLQKEGKSRFDFDRNTLYRLIADFVDENRNVAINQMKRLGFSLDWTRLKFTLDPDHTERIFAVFRKMHQDGLIYRGEQIVNYCTHCGTAFSNLEVIHRTKKSQLWYFTYPLLDQGGSITVATTRPETMLGDTAVAVNPTDKRYRDLIGKKVLLPLVEREIPIIADNLVDPKFGTGAVKVTPAHSPEDFQMAQSHQLPIIRVIDFDGKFNHQVPQKYQGLFVSQVRKMVVEDMTRLGLLKKTKDYQHEVGHCYKCQNSIEPLTAPQWFVKINSLAQPATKVVRQDKIKIFPARFKKLYLQWMKDIRDWPISRQIVWGHRIPAWYNLDQNPKIILTFIDQDKKTHTGTWQNLKDKHSFVQIKSGLQSLLAPADATYFVDQKEAQKSGPHILQETDTFDTWFSSGQWPYSTLGWDPSGNHSPDFNYFYPTQVMDTMWDILFFWVARMVMFGLYATGKIPFEVVHLHSRVNDAQGQKMSKSKGNVIDPIKISDEYGADALRLALVYGIAPASDIALSEDKIRAQRNFINKLWNASRFIQIIIDRETKGKIPPKLDPKSLSSKDKKILTKLKKLIKSTTVNLEKYRFGQATENLYQFFWHDFCDEYIEHAKDQGKKTIPVLLTVLTTSLKLLHPFAPFVTEIIYQQLKKDLDPQSKTGFFKEPLLISSSWPQP